VKRKRGIKVEFIGQRLLTDEEARDPRAGVVAQAARAMARTARKKKKKMQKVQIHQI